MLRKLELLFAVITLLALIQGCAKNTAVRRVALQDIPSAPTGTQLLAVYEGWFGGPKHISVGYSSHNPAVLAQQIDEARNLGISAFVMDWYGDREPFINRSYALLQATAAKKNFHVAMMYDEAPPSLGNTTQIALSDFDRFHQLYLSPDSPGHAAYLTYMGRPVIFIFPHGGNTDWRQLREQTNNWDPAPLLFYEGRRILDPGIFDGYYAWVGPGPKGWAHNGSNWGEAYLKTFYRDMKTEYPNKIPVGAAWPGFDDKRASWGQNRLMSERCGQTLLGTMKLAQEYYPPDHPLPFLLIETWNDYEEGTAIERGVESCKPQSAGGAKHSED